MCSEKSSKAFGAPSDGGSFARSLSSERTACLPGSSDGARHVSLSEPSGTMDGVADADTRDRTEQSALRVSQDPRAAEPRRLGCWQVPGISVVQGRRLGLEETAKAQAKGSAASGRAFRRHSPE